MAKITSIKSQDYLKKAQEYVSERRGSTQELVEQRAAIIQSLKEAFDDLNMGISGIQIGSDTIELEESNSKLTYSKEEEYFSNILNTDRNLYVISVHNRNTGYFGKEKVMCCDRSLSELIDEKLVKALAPTSKIYGSKDKKPWEQFFNDYSFDIFVTDYQDLKNLWENLKSWAKLDWHDNITKKMKHFHKAENVFQIDLTHSFSPDVSWRIAQEKNARNQKDRIKDLGNWNSLGQLELKKTINSLLQLEGHPTFGEEISKAIDKMIPLLAQSMEGKEILHDYEKKYEKARQHMYKGIKYESIPWKDWTPELPISELKSKVKVKKIG